MKRILLILCCLGMLCAARGQTQLHYWFDSRDTSRVILPITDANQLNTQIDVSDLTEGVHTLYVMAVDTAGRFSAPVQRQFLRTVSLSDGIFYRCWFDSDEQHTQTGEITGAPVMLNVSGLSDGLHTVYVQAYGSFVTAPQGYLFLKVPNVAGNEQLKYICSIDEQVFAQEMVSGTQEIIHLDLDVANLTQGLHKIQIMLATESGAVTGAYTTYFYRTVLQSEIENTRLVYVIDGKEQPASAATSVVNGALHYDLDVSSLSNGLHCINYSLVGGNGVYGTGNTQWFYKIPIGGEGLVSYEYWLNDDEAHMRHVDLQEHISSYELISLLPVDDVPVRSSLFEFAFKNDTLPVVYAKNDFHVRFWESGGSYALAEAQYIDERACDTVYADTLQSTNTISMPKKDTIYWYCVQAKAGDSIAIKTNRACNLHIFSPSAQEMYSADAVQSVSWSGCHAKEAGIYYIALHDYKADSLTSITLYSKHINRYAVLGQNVNRVGNGGYSTITYEGNGFDSLVSVYLIGTGGITIPSAQINHDSNVKASIAFDFTDVALGEYDAVFEFAEDEEIYLDENIVVEEPVDIVLTTSVDFPTTYLQGETVTYELTITNEGNMTAYDVPIYIYIASNTFDGISQIKLSGVNLPSLMEYIQLDSLSESERLETTRMVASLSDDHYFIKFMTTDEETGDSIVVRSNYFFIHIAPYETKKIELQLTAVENVNVWFTIPDEYIPYVVNMQSASAKRIKASALASYCCVRERIECVSSLVADLSENIPGLWGPVISCVTGTLSNMSSTFGHWRCLHEGYDDPNNPLDNANNTISIYNLVLDCAKKFVPDKIFSAMKAVFDVNKKLAIAKDITDCAVAFTQSKPNCPPGNPGGGKSTPVDPSDPNDIRGYISESGSRYMCQDIETIHYEIEFENDTAVATAPAHTIIVRDTLNANHFDLTSFDVTEISIGDRKMVWTAGQNGMQTMDMRTRMNVIAQVQLDYSEQTGIAQWTITSLDPMTMEPITEPDLGVLPVNFDGNGMGTISYRINLKNRFDDGTQIANRASIIFDNNEPILTPVWVNIVDAVKPVSAVNTAQLDADSVTFRLTTSDNRSGVWRRDVYARVNAEDEWQITAQSHTDTVVVRLTDGWRQFYVLAVDSAGNIEAKTGNPDYSLVLDTYLITFLDENGSILCSEEWGYGTIPTCDEPVKEEDEMYWYRFDRWNPEILPVTESATYTAVYRAIEKNGATDMESIHANDEPQKIMIDNIIYIIRGNRKYSIIGQEVK